MSGAGTEQVAKLIKGPRLYIQNVCFRDSEDATKIDTWELHSNSTYLMHNDDQ
jgi:hypothetical protein